MEGKMRVRKSNGAVTLKAVAEHVGLSAGTISAVLNNTPAAKTIPQHTKDRIFAAAQQLNYQPNPFARFLRKRHSAGHAANQGALVISGVEHLQRAIGAIRKAGLRVPEDVSVVGFDGIYSSLVPPVSAYRAAAGDAGEI